MHDPFTITAINGSVTGTGRPGLVERIFKADSDTYQVFAGRAIRPILWAGSLLMMEGPTHRAECKRVAPPLHGDRMTAYSNAMARIADQMAGELHRRGDTMDHRQDVLSILARDLDLNNDAGLDDLFESITTLLFAGHAAAAAFAQHGLAIVLGMLINGYDFELLDGQPVRPKRRYVTLGPATGVRMRIRPRNKG